MPLGYYFPGVNTGRVRCAFRRENSSRSHGTGHSCPGQRSSFGENCENTAHIWGTSEPLCGRLPLGSSTPGQLPAPRPASCRAHGLNRERQAYGTQGSLLPSQLLTLNFEFLP